MAGRVAQPALAWADRDGVMGRRVCKNVGRGLEDGWLKAFGGGEVEIPVYSGLEEGRNDRAVMGVGGVGIVGLLLDVKVLCPWRGGSFWGERRDWIVGAQC